MDRIEQVLKATKIITAASKPSVEIICSGLSKLAVLYKCVDDVLNSPSTRDLISSDQNKKWVEELLDESLTYLDVCGSTRDMVIQFKEHIRDLECALRMKKCENGIMEYQCFRQKMKKDVKVLLAGLKQVDNKVVNSDNRELAAVLQEVKRVSETTVSIFESLLLYISTPISKPNRWSSLVSKWIHKRKVACEDQQPHEIMNEFESIDSGLQALCKKESSTQGEKTQVAKFRFERQEHLLDYMEATLECIFRHLIGFRSSLLNIISNISSSSLSRCVQCPRHTNDISFDRSWDSNTSKAKMVESSGRYNIGGRKFMRMSDDGTRMSKIDQSLACNNVLSHWPGTYVTALPRYLSDHCPLELRFGPIPFVFFNSSLNSPGLKKLVEKSWDNSPQMDSKEFTLMRKLKNLKNNFKSCRVSCKSAEDTNKELHMNLIESKAEDKRSDLKQKAIIKWQIDRDENSKFDRSFLPDEIKEAVWACGNKKAPGPDGFTFKFIALVHEIVGYGLRKLGCNSSFISLIPKVRDPTLFKYYRTINLVGCLSKVISKLLATRVKKVISKLLATRVKKVISLLVGVEQSAYIEEYGHLIVKEVIAWAKKHTKKCKMFNVDFDKAFGFVNWRYLDSVREYMGL